MPPSSRDSAQTAIAHRCRAARQAASDPQETAALYEEITARGAAISEQPLGTRPTERYFPPRNRLIPGLSLGVVVVEAAPRSSSLITTRLALDQGREVFAVPGSPLDPRHQGTNELIR